MRQSLLERLSEITQEERAILAGGRLDLSRYVPDGRSVVDLDRLMGPGRPISLRPHTRFTPFPRHRHDYVEIVYMAAGSTTHRVGARSVTLGEGELLFLGRNAWHEIDPAGRGDVGVNFLVRPAFFHTAFDLLEERSALSDFLVHCLAGEGDSDEFLHFAAAELLPVQNLVENLIDSLYRPEASGGRIDELTMGLLLLHLLRCAGQARTGGGAGRALALRALAYVDREYAAATLDAFARREGVPAYTASRTVKAQLGTTFQTLLRERRLAAAERMLRSTRLPVAEIIAAVGYENTGHFYRAFRARCGCSPKEYRVRPPAAEAASACK